MARLLNGCEEIDAGRFTPFAMTGELDGLKIAP